MSIEHYLKSAEISDLCSLFKAVEKDTWERIKFSRETPGLRIMETTITQNIVYELRLLKQKYLHTGYSLFESRNEKANGHDLLLRIFHNHRKVYTYAAPCIQRWLPPFLILPVFLTVKPMRRFWTRRDCLKIMK